MDNKNRRSTPSSDRIPALDGVRAIAVLGVIASHSGLIGIGWVGVDIFFALSGYLITGILLDAKAAMPSDRGYFIPFYIRRALRILPLAWAVALIMAFIRGEWSGLPWYMAYAVNWLPHSPPPADLGHYWSLAVEEQFYTLWPAVVLFTSRRNLWRVSIAVITVDVLCRLGISMWPPSFATEQFQGLATYARADTLAIGALLALRQRNGGWGPERAWALPVAILAGAAFIGIHRLEQSAMMPLLTYNLKWPVLDLGVAGGLVFVLTRPPRFLEWRWMVFLGQISYGIYVIHGLFGSWLHHRFSLAQAPLIFVLQVSFTVPLAAASWHFFEAPILKQKWRWPMPSLKRKAKDSQSEPPMPLSAANETPG